MIGFDLTAEQLRLQAMAHEFAEKEMRPVASFYDEVEEFPWPVLSKAAQWGLIAQNVPSEFGGAGVTSLLTDCIVQEELFWGCAGIATAMGIVGLAATPILLSGTESQKQKYLPQFCSIKPDGHPVLGAYAITEPEAGSDAGSITASARLVSGGYVLNGTKQFITNGGIADLYIVFATQDPRQGADGIDAFIVEASWNGVRAGRKERKMGLRASHTAQVHFDNVFVPEENRLGGEGDGFLIAMRTFDSTRPIVASGAVGVARAAFDAALAYSQERRQFRRVIAGFQAVSFLLADMATELDTARLLVWRAAWLRDQGQANNRAASMAKQFAGDLASRVTTDAVQVFGAAGATRDNPVAKFMRDAKVFQIFEGTSQIQKLVIAKSLAGQVM